MANYYGNNDWRDYQSLQHWSWPNGNNSSAYNHDYWLKNKAKIMAKRADTAARNAKESASADMSKVTDKAKEVAGNVVEGLKDRDFHRKAAKRVAKAFGKDASNVEWHKQMASKPISLFSKKEENPKDKLGNGRKKTYGEGGGNANKTGQAKIDEALSKLGNSKVSSRPRSRKKTYGNGGGNANKGKSTGTGKKVGKR